MGCCFQQGSGPSAKNADNTGYVSTTVVMGANRTDRVESAVTVQWTEAARNLFLPHKFGLLSELCWNWVHVF